MILTTLATILAACGSSSKPAPSSPTSGPVTTTSVPISRVTALTLDPNKNYGNTYANGILPVGDNKYVTAAPRKGNVFVCNPPRGGGGAQERGPWFLNDGTRYDLNKKIAVAGKVKWPGSFSMKVQGAKRVITTNDLPRDHTTGVFPVAPADPAYQYDRNPNHIAKQSLTYTLNASPTVEATPRCIDGEIGVMTTGIALFDAFDAGGRDAGAWEVQDGCSGHPQMSSEYHYHTLSSCIRDTSVNTVIGFALDGFPITGPKVDTDNILTTSDLDECHGITSTLTLDRQTVETYHYVMTQDFPYSVSCYRSTPTTPPGRPG
jgi:hypothetical protein